jgi:hypothetical protein
LLIVGLLSTPFETQTKGPFAEYYCQKSKEMVSRMLLEGEFPPKKIRNPELAY